MDPLLSHFQSIFNMIYQRKRAIKFSSTKLTRQEEELNLTGFID